MKRIFVLLFVCMPVFADSIHVGAWSKHYIKNSYKLKNGRSRRYHESNGRIGYFKEIGSEWIEAGRFNNSIRINASYAGIGHNYYRSQHLNLGYVGGYVSGYTNTKAYAAATASVNTKIASLDFALAPKVLTASLRVNF